jgi:hypothetical protein
VSEQQGRDAGGADLLASGTKRERDGGRAGPPDWVWRVAGVLVIGLVAVLAGPQLLSSSGPGQAQASPRRSPVQAAPQVRPAWPRPVPPLRWASRGPDVGSTFAAAALARLRDERQGVDRLLWAGSLDGHDHVVVISYRRQPNQFGTDSIEVAALRVQRTRDVPTAHSETIGYVSDADGLVGLAWQGDDQHTRLLVLARPRAMGVQVSSVVDYDVVGRVRRSWRDTTLEDGVSVTDLGRHADPVILVRPVDVRTSTSTSTSMTPVLVQVHGRPPLAGVDEVTVAGVSSPSYAGPDPSRLVAALGQSVESRFDLRDADSTVVWSGKLVGGIRYDSGSRASGRGALVLIRRHDGPTFQAFIYSDPNGYLESSPANPVAWKVADRLPYAFSTHEPGAPLVLVNPGGPGSATITPGVGPTMHVRFDGNGLATVSANVADVPRLDGARVIVRGPSGRLAVNVLLPVISAVDWTANSLY